jgi:hypothetical protein
MWLKALCRFCTLLVIVVYAAATIKAAASPLAACRTLDLDHHSNAGHTQGAAHHEHGKHPASQPADCLNCCVGACLLGASLLPPSGMVSSAFHGARIVYASEEIALADRSIPPDPTPPKPAT